MLRKREKPLYSRKKSRHLLIDFNQEGEKTEGRREDEGG
jgi:hypothetical protein